MARAETQYNSVQMDDGRIVDFAGKRKMQKESIFSADGSIKVRLDFINGESRTVTLRDDMLAKYAAHGAEQKLGDEISGLDDIEDCIIAIDQLMERLDAGNWTVKREAGNSLAGTSVLARALVEKTGKSIDVIKSFLATKTQAQKVALRSDPSILPIVQRLEAAKAKKAATVDTGALLGELDA
jgi:hypothetical protein